MHFLTQAYASSVTSGAPRASVLRVRVLQPSVIIIKPNKQPSLRSKTASSGVPASQRSHLVEEPPTAGLPHFRLANYTLLFPSLESLPDCCFERFQAFSRHLLIIQSLIVLTES
jgi:hypothetical protein